MTGDEMAAYARKTYAETRAEQGLPPTPDAAALDRLAALIDVDPPRTTGLSSGDQGERSAS